MEPVIVVEQLTKTYFLGEVQVAALRGVTLEIRRGEFVAIMGASGSGKSTFLNLLGCLDRPAAGRYLLEGVDVSHLSKAELADVRKHKIGFVFQSFNLLPRTTALENVALPLRYRGIDRQERQERALAALQATGLAERAAHHPGQLSGGQQQRVAIARALVNQPAILLADEPTGNLDSQTSAEIMGILQRLNATQGLTILFVTHEPDIAQYAKRVIVFRDGLVREDRLVQQRTLAPGVTAGQGDGGTGTPRVDGDAEEREGSMLTPAAVDTSKAESQESHRQANAAPGRRRVRKVVMGLLLAVALGGLGSAAYVYYTGRSQQPLRYMTAPVERGTVATVVNATGIVNAVTTVQVGTQVSGIIKKLFVDFNTPVQEGEIIAQIDPAPLDTRVSQARARLASISAAVRVAQATVENITATVETARANADNARANVERAEVALAEARRVLERQKELLHKGLVSRSEFDTAQAAYDTAVSQRKGSEAQAEASAGQLKSALAQRRLAEAQMETALADVDEQKAALQATELDLQHTTIRAPVNGIVISRNVDVGQTVAASLQAPTLFLIAEDLTQMQVDTSVSEADIGRVQVGQTATFTVDAYPQTPFTGTVMQVRHAPITVQNVVTYNAVVRVANPNIQLKPGMTANVAFLIAERHEVIKVPNAALRFQPEGMSQEASTQGRRETRGNAKRAQTPERPGQVWVLGAQGVAEPQALTLGLTNDTHTEVVTGDLVVGQQVITGMITSTPPAAAAAPGFGPRPF